jgi:hypothetical protein
LKIDQAEQTLSMIGSKEDSLSPGSPPFPARRSPPGSQLLATTTTTPKIHQLRTESSDKIQIQREDSLSQGKSSFLSNTFYLNVLFFI